MVWIITVRAKVFPFTGLEGHIRDVDARFHIFLAYSKRRR